MAFTRFAFDPVDGWEDTDVFPTDPDNEAATRELLQKLHDQTLTFINGFLGVLESAGAAQIGTTVEGLDATNVQAALIELIAKFADYLALSDVTQTVVNSPTKVPSGAAVTAAMVAGGLGDMLASVYATNGGTGKVDTAVNAEKLGNSDASLYALKTWVNSVLPTEVSDLTNDSGFVTSTGSIAEWNGLKIHTESGNDNIYLCTKAQWEADSGNTDRAKTLYFSTEALN